MSGSGIISVNAAESERSPLETCIGSTPVFKGRIVSLRVDDVEVASGRRTTREVVERPDTVSVLAIDDEGHALLVRQYRYTIGRETVEIPAGTIDPGETAEAAARRELREETGYSCRELEPLISYGPAIGYCTERMTVFLARGLDYAPLQGDEDAISLERVPLDRLVTSITDGSMVFEDAKSVVAILLAHQRGLA